MTSNNVLLWTISGLRDDKHFVTDGWSIKGPLHRIATHLYNLEFYKQKHGDVVASEILSHQNQATTPGMDASHGLTSLHPCADCPRRPFRISLHIKRLAFWPVTLHPQTFGKQYLSSKKRNRVSWLLLLSTMQTSFKTSLAILFLR